MDLAAPHIGFVIAAYGLSAVVLIALALQTVVALRTRRRELSALEERQAPRRARRRGGP